ncbi:hypothetical protein C8R44DRAFT_745366 [Mycena epipterygia]|nr:hypothetical protein C8R44DRAFT_745366 [Mycena epipterygia]
MGSPAGSNNKMLGSPNTCARDPLVNVHIHFPSAIRQRGVREKNSNQHFSCRESNPVSPINSTTPQLHRHGSAINQFQVRKKKSTPSRMHWRGIELRLANKCITSPRLGSAPPVREKKSHPIFLCTSEESNRVSPIKAITACTHGRRVYHTPLVLSASSLNR